MDEGIKFWLWALFALFCFWLLSGGYNSNFAKGGPFLHPLGPLGSGFSYGNIRDFNLIPKGNFSLGSSNPIDSIKNANDPQSIEREIEKISAEIKKAQDAAVASPYKGLITLRVGNWYGNTASSEYLKLVASRDLQGKVLITGWSVRSAITYKNAQIGKAAPLPFTDQTNQEDPIFISAGDTVYINTGRSPIGISFKTNLCTGYFGQFQEFTPQLSTDCPRVVDEKHPNIANDFLDACEDYLSGMASCKIQVGSLPQSIGPDCNSFISTKINYPTCLLNHKNDFGFYKPEWRVFLKQDTRLWKDRREVIQLFDNKGKIVDTVSY